LTRKGSQVQTLSRPPPLWLVRTLSVAGGQHSSPAAAALWPQSAPQPNRLGPPELTTQDYHQPNDHGAWSPPPCPAHGRAPRRQPAQDAPAGGTGEHLLVLCSPANPTGTWRWTSSIVGEAAPQPVRMRCGGPGLPSTLVPPMANAALSLPFRPYAGRRPRRPRTTAARRTHCGQRGRLAAPRHSRI